MADYLQRDQSPLNTDQWRALDQMVVQTAQAILVGRRFLTLLGPFGLGVEALPTDILAGTTTAQIDLMGNVEGEAVSIERRRYVPLPLIYKDFWIQGRDLAANRQFGLPLDTSKAAAAAAACAQIEDQLIFDGNPALDFAGIRNADGRQTSPLGDWGQVGQGFADVVEGTRLLTESGFPGPYALIVSPRLYAQLNRIFGNTGVLEIEQVQKLARRGVYPTSALPEPSAVLIDSGPQNMDLAVSLDLSTAFVESNNLNYHFRVVESIALRIERPHAICTFESAGA
ncbi:MAG: family 1 encapsulin nanocompartment shell protein [Ktedonobacterales bacterium]